MDELACLMDWDLEAIVRGCTGEASANTMIDEPHPNFSLFCSEQDELLGTFPQFSETTKVHDELEELYKPFCPVLHPLSSQTIVTNSLPIPKETEEVKVLKASEKVALQDLQVPAVSKCKRSKKNQVKRVVKQVTAADGVCDAWAWRKYGQKPIKGSPYPRSYYRCSSSKGCLARKQVERSNLDPGLFLVTYTAEHSHPHPTRRNSLAGITRKNNSSIVAPISTLDQRTCSSNSLTTIHSPSTPLVGATSSNIEDEIVTSVQQSKGLKKEEDFLDWLDDAEGAQLCDGWIPSAELEELIGFKCQQLELDGSSFMDGFVDTLFLNDSNK
ncbi:probable WRKY transcription factor 29 [Gastrolobium bilobum]|uniref:probable WRKY transcription factor 29 n=1 Tax=Gastrolobium bilobum TaxID=150636 RepID=UPI002AAF19C7|nr:probable WRKY transcription factor 29 [Gastrolobium bilobum]